MSHIKRFQQNDPFEKVHIFLLKSETFPPFFLSNKYQSIEKVHEKINIESRIRECHLFSESVIQERTCESGRYDRACEKGTGRG